ncbi:M10 family metallopeptidase C-terminal domain-containing protein [Pseudomonas orientalis]
MQEFHSGIDKIDLTGVLQAAGLKSLSFSDRFSGRAGEAVLGQDSATGRFTLTYGCDLERPRTSDYSSPGSQPRARSRTDSRSKHIR